MRAQDMPEARAAGAVSEAAAGAVSEAAAGAAGAAGAEGAPLYPHCEPGVWLRTCEREVHEPLDAVVTGALPTWLEGALLRNGPGALHRGGNKVHHLFDGYALLHRFHISGRAGRVSYQSRFLRSRAWRSAGADGGQFGAGDPCRSIFRRVAAVFHPGRAVSDNAMISLYPFGDEVYAFTEGPVIHSVEPSTLQTLRRRDLGAAPLRLLSHTSHPHVMPNGDVYNMAMALEGGRPKHVLLHFPHSDQEDMVSGGRVVASLAPRWPLHPAYMHSFGVTARYAVVLEQPLSVSAPAAVVAALAAAPLARALRWFPDQTTRVTLVDRATGATRRYETRALFFLHVINACERDGCVELDVCAYRDAAVLDAMYIHAIENMQQNPRYAEWFRARPVRLRLPLGAPGRVEPEPLAEVGCETPTIHYQKYNGRPYRYFYAISSDVDADNPGTLLKVDTWTGAVATWSERGCYPSEPIFVPDPASEEEDGGVLLAACVWAGQERRATLLVLDARSMTESARAELALPSPQPKCLHGMFLPDKDHVP